MVSAKGEEAKAGVMTIEEATMESVSKPPQDKVGVIYRPLSASDADRKAI